MLGRRKDDRWLEDLLIVGGILILFFLNGVLLAILASIFLITSGRYGGRHCFRPLERHTEGSLSISIFVGW